ncbi:MAG: bacillithiol system redox-active protein YtxJ [Flavobacteriaceae bacterium]
MGLLNKLFGSSTEPKEEKVLPWIFLTSIDQLEDIHQKSFEKTQIIFKHSTRCSISSISMNKFVKNYNVDSASADLYYLDLLNYREVSNEVGYKFQVIHQSPQVLVIKDGIAVYDASHYAIHTDKILELI